MEPNVVVIDDQTVAPTFFDEGKWLTEYITPDQPDIQMLYKEITGNNFSTEEKVVACWQWVASRVQYKSFIKARINVEGKVSVQDDYWQSPSMCARTKVGNCANKAFLLTSLLRNALPQGKVHCVFGNLYNSHEEGHAWVEVVQGGKDYIVESTRDDVPLVEATSVDRYEPVHYFDESIVYAVPGRTLMTPFSACYSDWLGDYLNWTYINYMRRR